VGWKVDGEVPHDGSSVRKRIERAFFPANISYEYYPVPPKLVQPIQFCHDLLWILVPRLLAVQDYDIAEFPAGAGVRAIVGFSPYLCEP
jgi:hypothetical protein